MKALGSRVVPGSGQGDLDWSGLIGPEQMSGVIAAASDITLLVGSDGRVRSVLVNEASADFGKLDHWVGRPVRDFLTAESVPKLDAALERVAADKPVTRAIELNHRDNAVWDFPIRYTVRPVSPEHGVLLLGRDLRPVAETQRQLVQAQIALERGYETQRDFDTRYRLLLASVTDAIVLVGLQDGRISDLNEPAARALGGARRDLVGTVFASHLADTRRGELSDRLVAAALSEAAGDLVLTTQRDARSFSVIPSLFRLGGERVAICRLVATKPGGAARPPETGLSAALGALFESAVEGMVFTDAAGVISEANERFLALVDAAHITSVRGRPLGEFLARGQVDLSVLLENLERLGSVRLYASELVSDYGSRTTVELSATRLGGRRGGDIAFVLRDTTRTDAVRRPASEGEMAAQQNILDLVGSATLKEIVAETNDVIEKLCIETAIRLTNNNRVAAAEMLGLSRQSLYVKLRKYDFLKKGEDEDGKG